MERIVIFASSFPPSRGGGERYNLDLASELHRRGYDVHLLTNSKLKNSVNEEDKYEFKLTRLNGGYFRQIFQIYSIVRSEEPRIFHISGPTPIDYPLLLLLGCNFLKRKKFNIVVTYHADFPSIVGRLLNSMISLFQGCIDRILVQSRRDYDKITKRGVSKSKITHFPFNGINQGLYRNYDNAQRDIDLIFVGRMDRAHSYKGYWNLLRILTVMKNNLAYPVKIIIVGGGEDLPLFLEQANKNGIKVEVYENISDENLVDLLNRSKALILPSISDSEGFGRVVLEAVFCGAVPIVSKFAGSAEVVLEHECGVLINPLNVKGSANRIVELLKDEAKMKELRYKGETLVKRGYYNIGWTIDKTIEIYNEILNKNP